MKKKNNKGFTLIELLVVVAIIGILAAVGVVAYSGYTTNAKKSATKSNHATTLKYIAGELQKCALGDKKAMKDKAGTEQLTCANRKTTASHVSDATALALNTFKNAYGTVNASNLAVFSAAALTACSTTNEGRTNVTNTLTQVTITSCIAADDSDADTVELLSDILTIE